MGENVKDVNEEDDVSNKEVREDNADHKKTSIHDLIKNAKETGNVNLRGDKTDDNDNDDNSPKVGGNDQLNEVRILKEKRLKEKEAKEEPTPSEDTEPALQKPCDSTKEPSLEAPEIIETEIDEEKDDFEEKFDIDSGPKEERNCESVVENGFESPEVNHQTKISEDPAIMGQVEVINTKDFQKSSLENNVFAEDISDNELKVEGNEIDSLGGSNDAAATTEELPNVAKVTIEEVSNVAKAIRDKVPNGPIAKTEEEHENESNTGDVKDERDCDDQKTRTVEKEESVEIETLGQSNGNNTEAENNNSDTNGHSTPEIPRRKSKLPSDVSVSSEKTEEHTDAEMGLKKAAEKQMLERLISMVQDKISLAKKKNSETK